MTFREHTYLRRQMLSSHWTIEDMVYGAIGSKTAEGKNGIRHAINSHFRQNDAGYPDALPKTAEIIRNNWEYIVNPHPANFEELYARVEKLILNPIKGVGLVTTYDIALNIGCNLYPKVLPEKKVYLHDNCVKESARGLLGEMYVEEPIIDVERFKEKLPHWSAMEIEDILCVYHEEIVQNKSFSINSLEQIPQPLEQYYYKSRCSAYTLIESLINQNIIHV